MPLLDVEPTTMPSIASGRAAQVGTSFVPAFWAAAPSRISISANGGPHWIGDLEERLNELLGLEADWNTYGALPIDIEHVVDAVRLLPHLVDDDSPQPAVVPTVRRGVQFDWDMPNCALEIRVDETGASAWIEGPDGEAEGPLTTDLLNKARELLGSHTLVA